MIAAAAALPVVGNLLGGLFGSSSARKQRQAQEVANHANYQAQKEFAQYGIQWKAADAAAAGLHPMAALGASGAGFSPSYQAGDVGTSNFSGIADALQGMGQNTNRAQRANLSDEARELHALQVRRGQLENQLLEGQITQLWSSIMGQPSNPPAPGPTVGVVQSDQLPGQTAGAVKAGVVRLVPSESESTRPGDPGLAAGRSPLFRDQAITDRSTWSLLNPDAGEAFEAYGELAKPFLAGGAHLRRIADQNRSKGIPSLADKLRSVIKSRFPGKRSSGASSRW